MKNQFFNMLILFALFAMFATSCKKEKKEIALTGVTLNQTNVVLNTGTTDTLKVSVEPINATNPNVIMTTSNPTVATVDAAGVITAVAPGNSIITATSSNGNADSCYVTVTKWTTYNSPNSGIPSDEVNALTVGPNNNIWCCLPYSSSSKLAMFDGNHWTYYLTNSNISPLKIKLNAQGNVWIATSNGIYKFNGSTWTNYNSTKYLSSVITAMAIDSQNNIWLGNWRTGVTEFDGTNWINYRSNDGLASDTVSSIAIDAHNNIWVGTDNYQGISKFDGANWTTYNTSNSGLVDNNVNSIAIDKQGNVWLATDGGVSKFDGVNWTTYNKSNSGLNGRVLLVATGSQNNIWFYTSDWYLTKFDGTRWIQYSNVSLYDVYSIEIDAQGNKWISTWGRGVVKLQD